MKALRGEVLELVVRHGRARHQLAGKLLQGGDLIDLCFSGGWVTGRYEWSGEGEEPPRFHYSIELAADGEVCEGTIALPEGAIVRWPGGE